MSVFPFMFFLFFTSKQLHSSSETPTFNAVLPKRVKALSGSCVQIPCKFNVSDFESKLKTADSIFACWLKNTDRFNLKKPDNIVFNGSQNIIRGFSQIDLLGNVSQRECTTVFYDIRKNHSDNYYFRLQMEPNIFRATFIYSPVNIVVSDVPQPPELKPNDLQEVMEGTMVNVSCSAEAPCPKQPPSLFWSNIPNSPIITTQLQEKHDKTQLVFSQMTFNAFYMDHRKNISCTVTYPRNTSNDTTVETSMMLRVLFPPKETHVIIEPSASVSVGTNVILTCKSKASPSNYMNYTWYKDGEQKHLDFGEQITLNASRTSGGRYFCMAKNKHGSQKSLAVQLIVEGSSNSFVPLIAGCVGGVSALLVLFLLAMIFRRLLLAKASNKSIILESDLSDQKKQVQISSIYANSAIMTSEEQEMPKDENDEIHYGEIEFQNLKTNCTPMKNPDEETVYALVCRAEKEINQN
ncbi:myelin-associated glycoprotein-like [Xyrauchen texanus]|uniref:myelin-associated glycoprotein-like n=1 Tax=Xyrauchen texanus TaxID=154827 RepID=UPI002242A085|nr:myelin-associated glycoprotein-like [Xyrauchen texanus]